MSRIELKKELKHLVEQIKTAKVDLKSYQKSNRGCDGGNYFVLFKLRHEYRHKHIAYCMMKGRCYDVIEKPAENNKPDMQYVKELIDTYGTEKAIEDVRACA
jgi:hypothetical protein